MHASVPFRLGEDSEEARAQSHTVVRSLDAYSIHLEMTGGDYDKYPAKQHARRVAAKLRATHGLIYLVGQATVNWADSDQERPFRQGRYFYYLSGVDEAECHLTYDIQKDLLTLYVPNFDLHRAIWNGPTVTREEAQARYDVHLVYYFASLREHLERWTSEHNRSSPIYILHHSQKPSLSSSAGELWLDVERLQPAMDAARGVKDDYEIQLIRHANLISGLAHRKILENIYHMTNEAEIAGLFLDTCVSHGAKNQAYDLIAGSGENAAVLHYVKNNESLKGRQLVCLDAGAEWNCYASDVTRTFPLTGAWPSSHARDIYHLVEEMQEECIRRIQPGVRFLNLHVLAHHIAIQGLQRLGVLQNGTVEEIRESGASKVFFPHGLGHHVGLEVHDVSERGLTALEDRDPNYNYHHRSPCTLSAPVLEEGMVVTVEPGIYFSRLALTNAHQQPAVAKFINFEVATAYIPVGGVRIEDDILVTGSSSGKGYENLTTAPKGDAMLKIIRHGIDN